MLNKIPSAIPKNEVEYVEGLLLENEQIKDPVAFHKYPFLASRILFHEEYYVLLYLGQYSYISLSESQLQSLLQEIENIKKQARGKATYD